MESVILVDENDVPVGSMEKLDAHRKGQLHRAFSVFLFDEAGRWLLQQRAFDKYHSGGLWTNSCCSHPRPGESVLAAAHRRLGEELGCVDVGQLSPAFTFIYNAALDHGLTEHELDHVLIGRVEATQFQPALNPIEVAATRWISSPELQAELTAHPERFTVWFQAAFARVLALASRPAES